MPNSGELLNRSDNVITSASSKLAAVNLSDNLNINNINNSNQPSVVNALPNTQDTQQRPLPQIASDDREGQRGEEQQLAQIQEPQGLPSSTNPTEELVLPGSKDVSALETGTTTAGMPPLQSSQQLLPSTTLKVPSPSKTSPPDTVITSAIDSITGMNIQNGASAASNLSVTFTFEGLDDSGIAGYTCSIENLEPFYCSSPIIYDTSIPQESELTGSSPFGHSFQVSAIDNSGSVDPTQAVFNWMVTDPGSETTAPESFTPNTIAPSPPQLPIEQQQLPQITVPGPLLPNTIAPSPPQLPIEQQQLPQITVPGTLTPETMPPPNGIGAHTRTPQIIIPSLQTPFIPLQ